MIKEFIEPLIQWLHIHPNLAGIATFFISLAESLAFIGLLVPGSVIMTAIGALIGAGVLPIGSIFVWAILGAIAGDGLSYWFGFHYHEHIRRIWPFSRFPKVLQSGEKFFHRHGGKSVFLGRFVGPVRPIIPVVAGMMSMKPRRFLLANITSAILWAPSYMIPGILIGAASLQLSPEVATRFVISILLIVFVFWVLGWLLRSTWITVYHPASRCVDKLWHGLFTRPAFKWLRVSIKDQEFPDSHRQLSRCLAFIFLVALFLWIMVSVKTQGILTAWNMPIYHLFRGLRHPLFDNIALAITSLGAKQVVIPTVLIICLYFAVKKYWRTATHLLACVILASGGVFVIKQLVKSPRPTGLFQSPSSYSFPSGHATLSMLLFSAVAMVCIRKLQPAYRALAYYIALGIAAIVACSRLYLGLHWLTDVVAGIILGFAVVTVVSVSYYRRPQENIALVPFLSVFFIVYLALASGYFLYSHEQLRQRCQPVWPQKNMTLQQFQQTHRDTPLLRTNRLGHAVQVINIIWHNSLNNIRQQLLQQGWKLAPRRSLSVIIKRITANGVQHQLPLLVKLYNDQRPVLIVTKNSSRKGPPLVLRLWRSTIHLIDSRYPIWVGTINYQPLHEGSNWLPHFSRFAPVEDAVGELRPYHKNTQWKALSVNVPKGVKSRQPQVNVLLINAKP